MKERVIHLSSYEEEAVCICSNNKRFGEYIIDTVVSYVINFVFLLCVDVKSDSASFFCILISYLLPVLYYFIMETCFDKSIGKFILKTHVVDTATKGKPSAMKILGRSFARLIPFDAFSFLFAKIGWHDSLSGTTVVDDEWDL